MFDSIEARPFADIRKAHLEEDLRKAVRRYWKESREEPIYVIVKDGKKNILVDPYHIDYLQANGHYIDTVSYTHLDVYKRQLLLWLLVEIHFMR